MITLLNTSIITAPGRYQYQNIFINEAIYLVKNNEYQSAIGHQSTADIIATLLAIDCPVNRILYKQKPGDHALVFKLKGRPPEGKVLTIKEIEDIGYEWGLLTNLGQSKREDKNCTCCPASFNCPDEVYQDCKFRLK